MRKVSVERSASCTRLHPASVRVVGTAAVLLGLALPAAPAPASTTVPLGDGLPPQGTLVTKPSVPPLPSSDPTTEPGIAQRDLASSIVRDVQTRLRARGLDPPAPTEQARPAQVVAAPVPQGPPPVAAPSEGGPAAGASEVATEPTPVSAPIAAQGPELVPTEDIRAGPAGQVRERGGQKTAHPEPARERHELDAGAPDRRGKVPPSCAIDGAPRRPPILSTRPLPFPETRAVRFRRDSRVGSILLFNTFLAILLGLMACGGLRAPTRRSASPSIADAGALRDAASSARADRTLFQRDRACRRPRLRPVRALKQEEGTTYEISK